MRIRRRSESGQAFIEFTFVVLMLIIMLFGLIDFGRAIYEHEVLTNLSREGANLASRNTSLASAAAAVVADSSLNLGGSNGFVIVSSVSTSNNGLDYVTDQATAGQLNGLSSKVGLKGGQATVPVENPPIPGSNGTLYVAEVYYTYTPITPLPSLLHITMTKQLYDAAYFVGF